ncbi:MAG: hypothetical protein AABX16_03345 [Nanoarchaeota archaeon]
MVKIYTLFKKKVISRINELEVGRYINFFESSYVRNAVAKTTHFSVRMSIPEHPKVAQTADFSPQNFQRLFDTDNLEHCKKTIEEFPRWSIISGYYALHDITKLFIAKKFQIKIDFKVHATTIIVLRALLKNKELSQSLNNGYREFLLLANDLEEAKKERTKVQYYTGSAFLKEEYRKRARIFYKDVLLYIHKIKELVA